MLLHGSRRHSKRKVRDAINLTTRANVGVGAIDRAGDAATLLKCVRYIVCARGSVKKGRLRLRRPAHLVVFLGYDKVTESLRQKRNENETKTISTHHRPKRKRNLASCLILSPVIGRYRFRFDFVSFSFRFRRRLSVTLS
jgi:hypothetical protein